MSVFDEMMTKEKDNRVAILIVAAVLIASVLAASIYMLGGNKYEVLFSDVSAGDMQAITHELDSMGVAYEIEESSIMILKSEISQVRMSLANSSLLLSKNSGFEIFDNSEFGITEFAQQINYQRAMQGELSRTITAINGIKHARVHLVMPEAGLFQQDQKKPSASVTVFVEDGVKLTNKQIQGIQLLVSSSIEGMDLDSVTIADKYGLTLSTKEKDVKDDSVSSHLAKKIEMESYLQNKIIRTLEKAIGDECCLASIDVEMDFRTITKTREEVLPQDTSRTGILKERILKPAGKGKTQRKQITTDIEYKLGREVAQITESPGKILRIGVGIIVPSHITSENQTKIRDLAISSLGLDLKRGDTISVVDLIVEKQTNVLASATLLAPVVPVKSGLSNNNRATNIVTNQDEIISTIESTSVSVSNKAPIEEVNNTVSAEIMKLMKLSTVQISAILIFLLIITALVLGSAHFIYKKNIQRSRKLSSVERENLLKQVTNWMNMDSVQSATRVVSK